MCEFLGSLDWTTIISTIIGGVSLYISTRLAARLISKQTYRRLLAEKRFEVLCRLQSELNSLYSLINPLQCGIERLRRFIHNGSDASLIEKEKESEAVFKAIDKYARFAGNNELFIGRKVMLVWVKHWLAFGRLKSRCNNKTYIGQEMLLSESIDRVLTEFQDRLSEAISDEIKKPTMNSISSTERKKLGRKGIELARKIYDEEKAKLQNR